jgi:hypothetical protein
MRRLDIDNNVEGAAVEGQLHCIPNLKIDILKREVGPGGCNIPRRQIHTGNPASLQITGAIVDAPALTAPNFHYIKPGAIDVTIDLVKKVDVVLEFPVFESEKRLRFAWSQCGIAFVHECKTTLGSICGYTVIRPANRP